jgi:hypothetical protein
MVVKSPEAKERRKKKALDYQRTHRDIVRKCNNEYYKRNREKICEKQRAKYHAKKNIVQPDGQDKEPQEPSGFTFAASSFFF